MDEIRKRLMACGVDADQAIQRFMNNEALYLHFLRCFPADESMRQLREAFAREDFIAAFHAVHSLKGLAGNLSLMPLFATADAMTELLREGQSGQALARMGELETAYADILLALKEI